MNFLAHDVSQHLLPPLLRNRQAQQTETEVLWQFQEAYHMIRHQGLPTENEKIEA